jgi:hypothetical protein
VVGLAERLQSIETQLAEIKATLQQMNAAAGGAQGGPAAVARPPRTKRPAEPAAPSTPPKAGEPV